MSLIRNMMLALAAFVVVMGLTANPAFAKSTYGQCGPAVHNGAGLINAWGAMNVLNSSAANGIARSAGWSPMDGSMVSFIVQRGREFKLAQPADIEDFGCTYGKMYSVNKRHYGAGEHVIGIVPSKYDPNRISGTPRAGYHRALIWVHVVGRANCSNGFKAYVLVVAYVPNKAPMVKPVAPKKPKPGTVPIWIRKQAFSAASEEQLINPTPTNVFRFKVQCGLKGKPRYIVYQSDPQYAGACKTRDGRVRIWELSTLGPDKWENLTPAYQTFTLKGRKKVLAVYKDKQVKQPVATPPTPTPPTPTPPTPPSAPTYNCTGLSLSSSNLTATAAISIVTSGGAQFKNATVSWGDTQSTTGGLTQTHTYGSAGTYGVQAVVNFTLPNGSSASANCSGSVSVSSPPVQHWVQVSCTGFEELFGGESMIIKCDVSTDDQNAMISLDAHSNDANSRVSGINCYSQGGTPSCKGNGQFEFRVSGINDGTSTLSSSVTVTASANGVSSKPWTSDPFPIDPSGGGF